MEDSIALIIVFYNPTILQIERVRLLANEYKCIVIDNSESINDPKHSNVTYIPLLKNKGIAYAQNVGIYTAKEDSYSYVCFVDQDSSMSFELPKMLLNKFKYIKCHIDRYIGAIGPFIINEETGMAYRSHADSSVEYSQVDIIISSGTLIPLTVLEQIGYLDSDLFIDFVDHDLCFKLDYFGYNKYIVSNILLKHKIGKQIMHYLGQEIILSAPFRYYYIYRNSFWLCKRNYIPIKWKIKNLLMLFSRIPLMIFSDFYSTDRKIILSSTFRGIKDGLLSNSKSYKNDISLYCNL